MIKVGQIVKLKNPKKKGEAKRRWRILEYRVELKTVQVLGEPEGVTQDNVPCTDGTVYLRRLDTATHRLELNNKTNLTPISFWERIIKRY